MEHMGYSSWWAHFKAWLVWRLLIWANLVTPEDADWENNWSCLHPEGHHWSTNG
jgi:hypothetical protein